MLRSAYLSVQNGLQMTDLRIATTAPGYGRPYFVGGGVSQTLIQGTLPAVAALRTPTQKGVVAEWSDL